MDMDEMHYEIMQK